MLKVVMGDAHLGSGTLFSYLVSQLHLVKSAEWVKIVD